MKNTRRKFLRQSAKAAATLWLPTMLACQTGNNSQQAKTLKEEKSPTQKNKKLGIALLGLGGYSRGQLAPALQLTKHCELRGIVTGSPEKIPEWQKKYNIPDQNVYSYDNIADIANNDDIDVIYIVTPTGTHARFAIAAANTGKHVWCEKPMAMDVVECQQIIDACNRNNVKLSIGYRMQHETNTRTVIGYAETQPYGAIQDLTAHAGYGGSIPKKGWRANPKLGGGAIYDMGVYAINGLRYASNMEPIAVRNASQIIPDPGGVDVTTSFELIFPNGIIGQGRTSVVENINVLRVNCADGWYQLKPMQPYNGVVGETSNGKKLDVFVESQQAIQMDDDALAILNDTPLMVPGEEGLKDIRIVNAIFESAKTQKEIKL